MVGLKRLLILKNKHSKRIWYQQSNPISRWQLRAQSWSRMEWSGMMTLPRSICSTCGWHLVSVNDSRHPKMIICDHCEATLDARFQSAIRVSRQLGQYKCRRVVRWARGGPRLLRSMDGSLDLFSVSLMQADLRFFGAIFEMRMSTLGQHVGW